MHKNSTIPYYPDYLIRTRTNFQHEMVIETYVRIKHRGKWYDILVRENLTKSLELTPIDDTDKLECIRRLTITCYKVMILHKIDLKIKNLDGSKFYIPSLNQINESDRLLYKYFPI